ncbi:MAG: SUMF1/EgtB/PvdO family nonheme iron enzyme [Phycisphaerae bacterium]
MNSPNATLSTVTAKLRNAPRRPAGVRSGCLSSLAAGLVVVLAVSTARADGSGDSNGDGRVDAADFAALAGCMLGPGAGVSAGCDAFDFDGDVDVDLSDLVEFQIVFGGSVGVVIETVLVGNPGNPADAQRDGSFGSVSYVYRMGKYEVTAGQYAAFLNAVAAADSYGLYNLQMWTHAEGCKIERSGSPGSYAYSVAPDWANRPVNFVSFGDALRFANWLHNGQPGGAQDLNTTEDGSYLLDGRWTDEQLQGVIRKPDATWVVPSEDEWYKAAYHANDGVTGNYFNYPMGVDVGISNDLTDPDPGAHATYFRTPNDFTIGAPYYRTEVGAHENSASPYGTLDQGGNVVEWNESIPLFNGRGLRGGAYLWGSDLLARWVRPIEYHSSDEFSDIGFRIGRAR